ncbi:MAG: aldehyde dehydrogenase family protein [Gammaproteobacteria bacterium]|nr:aldehyde dehydrogenase family protein [Gammaproteobacteria bacterium]
MINISDFVDVRALPNHMVIGAERIGANQRELMVVEDPATGSPFAEIPAGTVEDVNDAVATAKSALEKSWKSVTPQERGRILSRTADIIRRDAERLACIETLDSGKPIREAKGDIETAAQYFEYYAGIADKLQGDTIPLGKDFISFTLHEPVGVTVHIIPWNFPLVTTARGVAPALAAGCTAVVKPAELTSLTAIILADILMEAGLPTGVYNVVTGKGSEIGNALTSHKDVAHVTFTGSVITGKTVMQSAADNVASVTLELGGKSPVVVLKDADMDAALEGTLKAIFMNAGQVCSAGSRLVIERAVHEQMVEKLVQRSEAFDIGHGLQDPSLGPLVSETQVNIVDTYVAGARERGVEVATGGNRALVDGLEEGSFYQPTILNNIPVDEIVAQEEIFGPVLAVQVVDSAEQAISVANSTDFGLVAGIYTRDITKAMHFARDVGAGQVFINQFFAGGVATPFGGVKNSGFGREKGLAALASYYQVKCVTTRI